MELVEGGNLKDRIRQAAPLPDAEIRTDWRRAGDHARLRPPTRADPSRRQTPERAARRGRPTAADRLRHRPGAGVERPDAHWRRSWARCTTSRRSWCAGGRRCPSPTSTGWASCCTRWRPAACPFQGETDLAIALAHVEQPPALAAQPEPAPGARPRAQHLARAGQVTRAALCQLRPSLPKRSAAASAANGTCTPGSDSPRGRRRKPRGACRRSALRPAGAGVSSTCYGARASRRRARPAARPDRSAVAAPATGVVGSARGDGRRAARARRRLLRPGHAQSRERCRPTDPTPAPTARHAAADQRRPSPSVVPTDTPVPPTPSAPPSDTPVRRPPHQRLRAQRRAAEPDAGAAESRPAAALADVARGIVVPQLRGKRSTQAQAALAAAGLDRHRARRERQRRQERRGRSVARRRAPRCSPAAR